MIQLNVSSQSPSSHIAIRLSTGDRITLGREATSDYAFGNDSQMSSNHLALTAGDDFVEIEDLASTNGTFLNGKRVNSAIAYNADEIRIGQTLLSVLVVPDYRPPIAPYPTLTEPRANDVRATKLPQDVPRIELEVTGGDRRTLDSGERLTVGRTTMATWVFESDPQISSLHFSIEHRNGQWEITDLQSSNGTFINERRIWDRTPLANDDEVLAGRTRFRVQLRSLPSSNSTSVFTSTSNAFPSPSYATASASNAVPKEVPTSSFSDLPTSPADLPTKLAQQPLFLLLPRDRSVGPLAIGQQQSIGVWPQGTARNLAEGTAILAPAIAIIWLNVRAEIIDLNNSGTLSLNRLSTRHATIYAGDEVTLFGQVYTADYLNKPTADTQPETTSNSAPAIVDTPTDNNDDPTHETLPHDAKPVVLPEPVPILPLFAAGESNPSDTLIAHHEKLPDRELNQFLLQLAFGKAAWLMEVSDDGSFISLPSRIAQDDEVWLYNLKSAWPKKNFVVAFSDATAEELFEALATLPDSIAPRFGAGNLAKNLEGLEGQATLRRAIQALLLLRGDERKLIAFCNAEFLAGKLKPAIAG